jgi:4-diphosphocytidyl-2-C-methyl-D-erythritol kinase
VKIRAPAKINLGLRVVGKRSDGYHLLDTVMVPVSLYDDIEISSPRSAAKKRPARLTVTCDHPLVPGGKKNIVYQAASRFLDEYGIDREVHIDIVKRIPVGAGLGGGSSDAAATLLGLNRLFHIQSPVRKLLQLAASLGADVPFFIRGVPARARGVGERLSPLTTLPRFWLVILYPYPEIVVSTAWVYSKARLKLTKPTANTSITTLLRNPEFGRLLVNELEPVAIARYPRVGALKEKLIQAGAGGALMSGSGSAVFGIFSSLAKARQAFNRLCKEEGVQAFIARVLT